MNSDKVKVSEMVRCNLLWRFTSAAGARLLRQMLCSREPRVDGQERWVIPLHNCALQNAPQHSWTELDGLAQACTLHAALDEFEGDGFDVW